MTLFAEERPHPLGITYNAEWDVVLTKRAELYIAERARRAEADHEPSNYGLAMVILAVIGIACALVGSVV